MSHHHRNAVSVTPWNVCPPRAPRRLPNSRDFGTPHWQRAIVSITNDDQTPDLIWGAGAIAKVIGRTERSTFHLLANELLPAKRVGGRWCASRRKLLAALIGDDESGAAL